MSREPADTRTNVIDIDDLREPRRSPEQQRVYEYGLLGRLERDRSKDRLGHDDEVPSRHPLSPLPARERALVRP